MKNLSLNKYLKLALTLSVLTAFCITLYGGWAVHRQETSNNPVFWDEANRTLNGFGVLALFAGWGFWEFYISAKNRKDWQAYTAFALVLTGTIMINGVIGLVAGFIGLVLIVTIFALIKVKGSAKEAK